MAPVLTAAHTVRGPVTTESVASRRIEFGVGYQVKARHIQLLPGDRVIVPLKPPFNTIRTLILVVTARSVPVPEP